MSQSSSGEDRLIPTIAGFMVKRSFAVVFAALWLLALDRVMARLVIALPTSPTLYEITVLFSLHIVVQLILLGVLLLALGGEALLRRAWRSNLLISLATGALFAALGAWPMDQVFQKLTSGDWIAQQPWAGTLRWGLTLGGALGAFLLGVAHFHLRRFKVWVILLLICSLIFSIVDAKVLAGLYGRFHVLIAGLSALTAFLAFQSLLMTWRPRLRWYIAIWPLVVIIAGPVVWGTGHRAARPGLIISSTVAADVLPLLSRNTRLGLLRVVLSNLDLEATILQDRSPHVSYREPKDLNVILVVLDTLRYDALAPHRGEGKPFAKPGDTPFIDSWLDQSVYFTHAYAQGSRTMFSMPYMMRSIEPFEDPTTVGAPIAQVMEGAGRRSIAVIPHYFMLPMDKHVQDILDGFNDVEFIEEDLQHETIPRAREMLSRNMERPFFAWIHFFNIHQPGYADGRLLTRRDGDLVERYRMSLRDMDKLFKQLDQVFKDLKLYENSVIIFAADHGESLGERGRFGHGASTIEHQIRVPLAIRVPGQRPLRIDDQLVGNIDFLPTALDLMGFKPPASLRGRSLVPLMDDPKAPWGHAYASQNGSGREQCLVDGTDKLVIKTATGDVLRFDLAADKEEAVNLHRLEDPVDQRLARLMLMRQPRLARAELIAKDQPGRLVRSLLRRHLEGIDPKEAARLGRNLSFLMNLVAISPEPETIRLTAQIFEATDDLTRLRIASALPIGAHPALSKQMLSRLEIVRGTEAELLILRRLAEQGQAPFEERSVAQRLTEAIGAEREALRAWLELTRSWRKPSRIFGKALQAVLKEIDQEGAAVVDLRLILQNLSRLKIERGDGRLGESLARQIEALLLHPDPLVEIDAALALKSLNRKRSVPALVARLKPGVNLQARQAALRSLARIEGHKAVRHVTRAGDDPLLALDSIELLAVMGPKAKASLPWLRKMSRKARFGFARRQSRRAIKRITGKKKKKAKAK